MIAANMCSNFSSKWYSFSAANSHAHKQSFSLNIKSINNQSLLTAPRRKSVKFMLHKSYIVEKLERFFLHPKLKQFDYTHWTINDHAPSFPSQLLKHTGLQTPM